MSTTLILIPFDEQYDHLGARDAAGNLEPLEVVTTLTTPAVVDAYTGRGRDFDGGAGLAASDVAGRDTLTTRDATVQALVSIRADSIVGWPRVIYMRGLEHSSSPCSLGLRVGYLLTPGPPTHLQAQLFWCAADGTLKVQPGATFMAPGDDRYLLLTATRRWVSATEVVVRYYLGDELLAEHTTADGDIGGETTATTFVGCSADNAFMFRNWDGTIDQLKVTDHEMSHEEVRAVWERLTVHQPAGVELVTGLAPPGSGWGRDRTTRISKLARVVGTGLGYALAKAEELRANWLPDRAYAAWLPRWERLFGLAARPLESLDTRRARVVAFASRDNGYAVPQLQEALAERLDQVVGDVDIRTFSNRIRDDFATLEDERWHHEPAGVWTIASGELDGNEPSGSDMRWDASNRNPFRCITPLSTRDAQRFVVVSKFTVLSPSSDGMVGLHVFNWANGDGIWFGVRDIAGTDHLGVVTVIGGVQTWTSLVTAPTFPGATCWLRIRRDVEDDGGHPDRYVFGWSVTSEEAGWTEYTLSSCPTDPEWVGYALLGFDASTAASNQLVADDFFLYEPKGIRPFAWYAYRDPGAGGAPDLIGANLLLRKLKPAHTHAAAVTSMSLLCDDLADGGCDRGPMGGI